MKARVIASVVLAGALVFGTSACNLISPQATTKHYDASDGVSANVGNLRLRNAIVVSGDGSDANLIVTIINTGSAHMLSIQYGTGDDRKTAEVLVDGNTTTRFGGDDNDPILLSGLEVKPGSLTTLYFQYGNEAGTEVIVPVLDGTLPEYGEFLPGE